jgi:hypothetical protein
MTGSLVQLQAQGRENVLLTENPDINIFKYSYFRHINFSTDIYQTNLTETATFGRKTSCNILKKGHLLSKLYLQLLLPPLEKFDEIVFTSPSTVEAFQKIQVTLPKNIIIKAIYFSFYWICKSLFFIFKPLYKRLESKKNNNFDSVKNLFVKRLSNTEFGGLLPLLGFSNDKKGDEKNNKEEGIGNIMNIFGDLGELHKLFEDTKSSKSTTSTTTSNDSHSKNKISDPKWLKRSTQSSTDNLDKYMLSNIVSNKDFNKIANLNNKKIIEITENIDNKKNSNKNNSNKNNKKNSNKNNEKNSEELANLYKKMNDVFSSMQINKKK